MLNFCTVMSEMLFCIDNILTKAHQCLGILQKFICLIIPYSKNPMVCDTCRVTGGATGFTQNPSTQGLCYVVHLSTLTNSHDYDDICNLTPRSRSLSPKNLGLAAYLTILRRFAVFCLLDNPCTFFKYVCRIWYNHQVQIKCRYIA